MKCVEDAAIYFVVKGSVLYVEFLSSNGRENSLLTTHLTGHEPECGDFRESATSEEEDHGGCSPIPRKQGFCR